MNNAEIESRISFLHDLMIMEVDFGDIAFETSDDVNAFYDVVDELVEETGQRWFFMVNYKGCKIDPNAWMTFAHRGKKVNLNYSLGTVRYDARERTGEEILEKSKSENFDANLLDSRENAVSRVAELRAELFKKYGRVGQIRPSTADAKPKRGADWEARYREGGRGMFGDAPNEYVRQIAARSDFAIKEAVFLADGDGRNSRWLAGQDVTVSAVDISETATELAKSMDEEAGLSIERVTDDLRYWQPQPGTVWDAAFMIYLQTDRRTRRLAVQMAAEHLRAGGWFIAEGFGLMPEGAENTGMGPEEDALRYDINDLKTWLPDFQIVEGLTGTVLLDEGERHKGEAWVVRFAARKPR